MNSQVSIKEVKYLIYKHLLRRHRNNNIIRRFSVSISDSFSEKLKKDLGFTRTFKDAVQMLHDFKIINTDRILRIQARIFEPKKLQYDGTQVVGPRSLVVRMLLD